MDWTAGYASDVEYTAGFYREQSPHYLNFACVINGYEPVSLEQSFTYFELGFGRGLTVNLLAASNPHGQFYAADFNPAHVAEARQMASAAQLDNLTLLESSFADLAQGKVADLPQFDFITLHGIYTWVTAENQRNIVDFIARYLKPGGIVYASYNTLPGWSAAMPLQRLLVEHADLNPNRSDIQVKNAAGFVEAVEQAKAQYFLQNPSLKNRLEGLKKANANYLVHEYMHHHWQPLYHADVARAMQEAKLDFVASADLPFAYPMLYIDEAKQTLLNGIPDGPLRETLKDYFLNTGFRKDIFVRGARRMNTARQAECLQKFGLALDVPRANAKLTVKLPIGEVNATPALYNPILDALAQQPQTMAALAQLPCLLNSNTSTLMQIAAILIASGQASPFTINPRLSADNGKRFNRALAGRAVYGDIYQALAAPLTGNGLPANYTEKLLFALLETETSAVPTVLDAAALATVIAGQMKRQNQRLLKEGNALEWNGAGEAELTDQISKILELKLPVWRQLMML